MMPSELRLGHEPAEVRKVLTDLLTNRDDATLGYVDLRRELPPYQIVFNAYVESSGSEQPVIKNAVVALLDTAVDELWDLESFHNLLVVIEELPVREAEEPLMGLVKSRALLDLPDGRQRHRLVLRTLTGLGEWLGSPGFWYEQHQLLEGSAPVLTFKGLLPHGLRQVFGCLPHFVRNRAEAEAVLALFPSLVNIKPWEQLSRELARVREHLNPDVKQTFEEWFRMRGYGSPFDAEVEPPVVRLPIEGALREQLGHVPPPPARPSPSRARLSSPLGLAELIRDSAALASFGVKRFWYGARLNLRLARRSGLIPSTVIRDAIIPDASSGTSLSIWRSIHVLLLVSTYAFALLLASVYFLLV